MKSLLIPSAASLLLIILLKSADDLSTDIPKSSALLMYSKTWALFNSAFVGMHPQFRQTPPKLSFSIAVLGLTVML